MDSLSAKSQFKVCAGLARLPLQCCYNSTLHVHSFKFNTTQILCMYLVVLLIVTCISIRVTHVTHGKHHDGFMVAI